MIPKYSGTRFLLLFCFKWGKLLATVFEFVDITGTPEQFFNRL